MNNNKNVLLWVVGIIVVVIIIAVIAMSGGNSSTSPTATSTDTTAGTADTSGTAGSDASQAHPSSAMPQNSMSLKQLAASTNPQSCTFVDTSNTSNVQGTIYLDGTGRVRGDMNVTSNNKLSGTHMLVVGGESYVWIDGMTTGFKSATSMSDSMTAEPTTNGINVDKQMNYTCQPWTPDPSKFVLPTSVTFVAAGSAS